MARSRLGVQAQVDVWVGKFIGERRREIGLTQGDVGRAIGVTTQQVHRYEVGRNGLSSFVMLQLSKVLSCDLNAFVSLVPPSLTASAQRGAPEGASPQRPGRDGEGPAGAP